MSGFSQIAEAKIAEAMRAGAFDDLPRASDYCEKLLARLDRA